MSTSRQHRHSCQSVDPAMAESYMERKASAQCYKWEGVTLLPPVTAYAADHVATMMLALIMY